MIIYPGRIEENNLGDIIINTLLIRELSKYSKVLIKSSPNQEMLNLIFRDNKFSCNIEIYNASKNIIWYKLCVLKLLLSRKIDYSFETPGHLCSRSSKVKSFLKILLDIIKVYIYRFFGVKYIQLGITLGPYTKLEWFFVKHLNRLSYKTVVRDKHNYEQLKQKGLNVNYIHDLAFLLYDNELINNFESSSDKFDLGVSLRGSLIGHSLDREYFDKQLNDLSLIISKNLDVIKSVIILFQVHADENTSIEINNFLKIKYPNISITFRSSQLKFDEAITYYKSSNYLITNRLHVYLIAMIVGSKTLVLTDIDKHQKLISIIKDLHLEKSVNNSELADLQSELLEFKDVAKRNKKSIEKFIACILKTP